MADWGMAKPTIGFVWNGYHFLGRGTGTLPAANANAMLRGCDVARRLLDHELAMARFERRTQETEGTERAAATEAVGQAESAKAGVAEGNAEPTVEHATEDGWTAETAPAAQARETPFLGDVKGAWGKGLAQMEKAMTAGCSPAKGETWTEWEAARRTDCRRHIRRRELRTRPRRRMPARRLAVRIRVARVRVVRRGSGIFSYA
jgi:hypothetical protein